MKKNDLYVPDAILSQFNTPLGVSNNEFVASLTGLVPARLP